MKKVFLGGTCNGSEWRSNLIKKLNEDMNILLLCFTKGWVLNWEVSIIQHREIINAILEKNKVKAESLIRNHIKALKEEYDKKNF